MSSKNNKPSNNAHIHDRVSKTTDKQIEKTQREFQRFFYFHAGHLGDQMLKYQTSSDRSNLSSRLIDQSIYDKAQQKNIRIEGINLSRTEEQMVHAINKLLHLKSPYSPKVNYYSGNIPSDEFISYGGQDKPKVYLSFTWNELCRVYLNKFEYSGSELNHVTDILLNLSKREFLIIYDRIRIDNKEKVTDRIERVDHLFRIISYTTGLTNAEVKILDSNDLESIKKIKSKKTIFIMAIHPIFNDQIDTKFIVYPSDIYRQLMIAAGGHQYVTTSMTRLMGILLRVSSSKKIKIEFNHETLPRALSLENYLKQGRKKQLWIRIDKDCKALQNLGLLEDYEDRPNSKGSLKRIFSINPNFQK